jgi:hypothetical protein
MPMSSSALTNYDAVGVGYCILAVKKDSVNEEHIGFKQKALPNYLGGLLILGFS